MGRRSGEMHLGKIAQRLNEEGCIDSGSREVVWSIKERANF